MTTTIIILSDSVFIYMHTQTENPSPPVIRNCSITNQLDLNVSYLDIELQNSGDENLSYKFLLNGTDRELPQSLHNLAPNKSVLLKMDGTLTGNVSLNSVGVDMCNRESAKSDTVTCKTYPSSSNKANKSSDNVLFTIAIAIIFIKIKNYY